jgi:hypothetical protein
LTGELFDVGGGTWFVFDDSLFAETEKISHLA